MTCASWRLAMLQMFAEWIAGHGRFQLERQRVEVGLGAQDVVAAADDAHEVGLEGEGVAQLWTDDVGELAAAYGQVRVAETLAVGRSDLRQVRRQPVGPAGELAAASQSRVVVAHPLRERVTDRDVAGPDSRDGALAHVSLQSMPSPPCCTSRSLARLNGRDPKNPLLADRGEGWALSMRGTSPSRRPSDWAFLPQRMATSGPPRAARAVMAAR